MRLAFQTILRWRQQQIGRDGGSSTELFPPLDVDLLRPLTLVPSSPMSRPARPPPKLGTLPSDVLHEILSHILTDTSLARRTAVLLSCRALHDAAGRLLYRSLHVKSLASWKTLLERGDVLLTVESGRDLGRHVRELRLRATGADFSTRGVHYFSIGTIDFPHCTHLTIELDQKLLDRTLVVPHPAQHLQPVLSQLRHIQTLVFTLPLTPLPPPFKTYHTPAYLGGYLGLPSHGWSPTLQTVHFEGVMLTALNSHKHDQDSTRRSMLALSEWDIPRVVISPSPSSMIGEEEDTKHAVRQLGSAMYGTGEGVQLLRAGDGAFAGWGKVEVRVGRRLADDFRTRYKVLLERLTASEDRRFFGLVVFVEPTGEESRLVQ